MNKALLGFSTVALLSITNPASAQLGGLTGGLFNALPSVLNGITNKVMGQDPASIKGVDRAEAERNFEAQTRGMSPEQKAAMRIQYERALGMAEGAANVHRAAAQQAQDAPILDPGAIVGSFVGGVAQNQLMWGQVRAAGALNSVGMNNAAVASTLGGASPAALGSSPVAAGFGGIAGNLFNRIAEKISAPEPFTPSAFLGVDVRQGTHDDIDAALTAKGILATGAEPRLANIALLLSNPKVSSNPTTVKIGFDPASRKIALLSHEYEHGGAAKFEEASKILLSAYGQPTSQSSADGVSKFEWKIAEGEGYVLSRADQAVSIAYQNGPRYKLMTEAWNQAMQKKPADAQHAASSGDKPNSRKTQ
jgi:hypothetical protein